MTARRTIAAILFLLPLFPIGCASSEALPPTFAIAPGGYDRAFDAARGVLRDARFPIDRVDARAGVISTSPKRSSGLATPWDGEQSSARDEFEDLFNHQQRTVRVTFEPVEPLSRAPDAQPDAQPNAQLGEAADPTDLRRYGGALIARVQVVIEREHRPGWRVQSVAIGSSTFTQDPALGRRGMAGSYWVPVAQDPSLAGRLAARIGERLGNAAASTPAAPSAPTPIASGES